MPQEKYSRKGRKFKHLTKEKRAQIEVLLKQKIPKTEIAKIVGIARSTLYNELKRGTVEQIDTNLKPYKKYFCDAGQRVYEQHRRNNRPSLKLVQAYEFIQYAENRYWKRSCLQTLFAERQGQKALLPKLYAQKRCITILICAC